MKGSDEQSHELTRSGFLTESVERWTALRSQGRFKACARRTEELAFLEVRSRQLMRELGEVVGQ